MEFFLLRDYKAPAAIYQLILPFQSTDSELGAVKHALEAHGGGDESANRNTNPDQRGVKRRRGSDLDDLSNNNASPALAVSAKDKTATGGGGGKGHSGNSSGANAKNTKVGELASKLPHHVSHRWAAAYHDVHPSAAALPRAGAGGADELGREGNGKAESGVMHEM